MEELSGVCRIDGDRDTWNLFTLGQYAQFQITRQGVAQSVALDREQLRHIRDWISTLLGVTQLVRAGDPEEMTRLRTVLAAKERECEELRQDYQEMATNFEAADRELERLREFGKHAMATDLRKPVITGTPHGLAGELESIHFTGDGTHVTMTFEVKGAA